MNVILEVQMPPLILGGKEGGRRGGGGRRKSLFRNTILITESEHKIRSFVYPTSKRWKSMGKMRH